MSRQSGYRFLLTGEAFRFLLTLRAIDRQGLDHVFQSLVDQPFLAGDYQEQTKTAGRWKFSSEDASF